MIPMELWIFILQILIAIFGSFGALRALDNLSGISFKEHILSKILEHPMATAVYASVRFASVTAAMAWLCGRYVGL